MDSLVYPACTGQPGRTTNEGFREPALRAPELNESQSNTKGQPGRGLPFSFVAF